MPAWPPTPCGAPVLMRTVCQSLGDQWPEGQEQCGHWVGTSSREAFLPFPEPAVLGPSVHLELRFPKGPKVATDPGTSQPQAATLVTLSSAPQAWALVAGVEGDPESARSVLLKTAALPWNHLPSEVWGWGQHARLWGHITSPLPRVCGGPEPPVTGGSHSPRALAAAAL